MISERVYNKLTVNEGKEEEEYLFNLFGNLWCALEINSRDVNMICNKWSKISFNNETALMVDSNQLD